MSLMKFVNQGHCFKGRTELLEVGSDANLKKMSLNRGFFSSLISGSAEWRPENSPRR